jgi:hypothetical protein
MIIFKVLSCPIESISLRCKWKMWIVEKNRSLISDIEFKVLMEHSSRDIQNKVT